MKAPGSTANTRNELTRLPEIPTGFSNLGDPRALGWLTDHISSFLLSEGVTIYRQDSTSTPPPSGKLWMRPTGSASPR